MNYAQLLEQVRSHVVNFYTVSKCDELTYHNIVHVEDVVASATKIASHYKLNDHDFFIVLTAAWFHDIGYCNGKPEDHERTGADLATSFLKTHGVDDDTVAGVVACIMATKLPQQPVTLLEEIICDADLYHLGTDDFSERNKMMRKEMALRFGRDISKSEWRQSTIRLLEQHHYHTDYCKALLQEGKEANVEKLRQKEMASDVKHKDSTTDTMSKKDSPAEPEKKTKKEKEEKPSRGIETMFRVTSSNHQRLSDMADNKAHIMITTTSIIISVLLSVLLRKLEDNPSLTIPTFLLLAVCVITMVFSILATRPILTAGVFSQQDLQDKKVNLLFFGNFYKMSFEDYTSGMQTLMEDRDFLYGSLTKDIYSQGVVLGKKYKLLRIGYNVFMYGIILSVLAFVIATVFFSHYK